MNTVVLKGSLVASLCCAFEADAQTAATPPELPPVMVTATRIESLAADAPASITRIDGGSWFAALNWAPPTGLRGGVEARYVTGVFVNDANSDVAPRYAVAAASVGYVLPLGNWELNGFVRRDNKFGRRYAGSAIVNEGNARYFEPAPGRTWLASLSATSSQRSRPFSREEQISPKFDGSCQRKLPGREILSMSR